MNYATIKFCDVANGPGVRISLFVSGCEHYCKGCFNSETWSYDGGYEWTEETNKKILELMDRKHIRGLSLLGGDPICAYIHYTDNELLFNLIHDIKEYFPEKTIWLWTGYYFEELVNLDNDLSSDETELQKKIKPLLEYIDVIVDGPYMEKLNNLRLPYAGSENQRVINVTQTINSGKIVLYEA